MEQIVLAVAKTDFDDDRDGASFMVAEERRMARNLAKQGLLRIVSDAKPEVVAVLTPKGDRLIAARKAMPAAKRRPTPAEAKSELAHLEKVLRTAKIEYQQTSDWFQRVKRQGGKPGELDRAYKALGETSARYENAETDLEAFKAKRRRRK